MKMGVAKTSDEEYTRKATFWDKFVTWWGTNGITLIFVISFFVVWQLAVDIFDIKQYILPAPLVILGQLGKKFPIIWRYTLVTGVESLVGFLLAISLGTVLSITIAFSRILRQTLYPAAVTLEMVPKIAFAPLFVVWFGFGFLPKMIIVFLVCFFSFLLNGILGFTSLSQELRYFMRSTGAGPITAFFKIRLPAALPQLFVGLKGAATGATVGAVISEWIGGDAGLGYYIQMQSGDLRMDNAFAAIIVLALMGLLLFYIVVLIEKRAIPWHVSVRTSIRGKPEAS
jgi:NitT/TauT family transport system permease protein